MDFAIEVGASSDPKVSILKVRGELDSFTSPQLNEEAMKILTSCHPYCIIELSETNYLDSSALHVLFQCMYHTKQHGGKIALACLNPRIDRVFRITKMDKIISIFDTVEDATEFLACT